MADQVIGNDGVSRRDFVKKAAIGAAVVAGASAIGFGQNAAEAPAVPQAHVAGKERIRIGLVGCGGRGTGAAGNCCTADKAVEIVAMGDLFPDRLATSRKQLEKYKEQYKVSDDSAFTGFDAYKKVIDSDIDLVLLCEPPGFRPTTFGYAVEKKRHIFFEKPVAVDPVGVRKVLASAEQAVANKLTVVAGTCFRHDARHLDIIKRIHDGAIGEIRAGESFYNSGGLWLHPRQPQWTEAEYQIRNWTYYTWLAGDHFVEQHIHRVDIMNWIMQATPVTAYGVGGRQVRTDPAYGNVWDHFCVEFEFANGVRWMSMCRQTDNTDPRIRDIAIGTTGVGMPLDGLIRGSTRYTYRNPNEINMYVQEHIDLIDSMRGGTYRNEGKQIAETCLTGVMGRMAAYTGKTVTWDFVANQSKLDLWPKEPLKFGPLPIPPVAMPGKDQLI